MSADLHEMIKIQFAELMANSGLRELVLESEYGHLSLRIGPEQNSKVLARYTSWESAHDGLVTANAILKEMKDKERKKWERFKRRRSFMHKSLAYLGDTKFLHDEQEDKK